MEGLLLILKAAYCRSTHHHFALDSLRYVRTDAGRALARMLLRYHSQYLAGAKDPDVRFRDFQNHVVHVADNYWGGAPRAAERWYQRIQTHLKSESWADAAHATGVLSHYFTDPLQPLHTAQSPREAVVHRPLEWTIRQSYSSILSRWRDDRFRIIFQLSSEPDWLPAAVRRGAELAHRSYETLVSSYDLEAARKNSRQGLSEQSLDALAELFGVAIVGWARILDRTAAEAVGPLPRVSLSSGSLLAALRLPVAWLGQRLDSRRERELVRQLLQHYHETGELGPHEPAEVQLVRRVLEVRDSEQEYTRLRELAERGKQLGSEEPTTLRVVLPAANQATAAPNDQVLTLEQSLANPQTTAPEQTAADAAARPTHEPLGHGFSRGRPRLTLTSPIVDAPSIGPKTAARFERIEIKQIGQFLHADPERLVAQLQVGWIGVAEIAEWQSQTRLMLAIPSLRVCDAQLLVGAGYCTLYALATADSEELLAKFIRFADGPAGRRFLWSAKRPGRETVLNWISLAKQRFSDQQNISDQQNSTVEPTTLPETGKSDRSAA